jgi:hypothetical protein
MLVVMVIKETQILHFLHCPALHKRRPDHVGIQPLTPSRYRSDGSLHAPFGCWDDSRLRLTGQLCDLANVTSRDGCPQVHPVRLIHVFKEVQGVGLALGSLMFNSLCCRFVKLTTIPWIALMRT